jgi:hypothetical protein
MKNHLKILIPCSLTCIFSLTAFISTDSSDNLSLTKEIVPNDSNSDAAGRFSVWVVGENFQKLDRTDVILVETNVVSTLNAESINMHSIIKSYK